MRDLRDGRALAGLRCGAALATGRGATFAGFFAALAAFVFFAGRFRAAAFFFAGFLEPLRVAIVRLFES
jgi:hypothetical protein